MKTAVGAVLLAIAVGVTVVLIARDDDEPDRRELSRTEVERRLRAKPLAIPATRTG